MVGYIPQALKDREVAHVGLSELIVTDSMHTRKQAMCDAADGFVALPGGFGTLDEVMEILTWNQIGIIRKPVAFLDVEVQGTRYYEPLFTFFDTAVTAGLIKPAHRAMAQRATTVARRDRDRHERGPRVPQQMDRPDRAVDGPVPVTVEPHPRRRMVT